MRRFFFFLLQLQILCHHFLCDRMVHFSMFLKQLLSELSRRTILLKKIAIQRAKEFHTTLLCEESADSSVAVTEALTDAQLPAREHKRNSQSADDSLGTVLQSRVATMHSPCLSDREPSESNFAILALSEIKHLIHSL